MKIFVTFDVSDAWREVEDKAKNAQSLLDDLIYDYQVGMATINSVTVESRRFLTTIEKTEEK